MVERRDPHIVVLGILIIAFGIFITLLLLISSNFSPDNYFNIFLLSGIFGFFGLFVIVWFSKAFPAHEREVALSRTQALVPQLIANNVDAYYKDKLVRIRGLSFDATLPVEQKAGNELWYELDAFVIFDSGKIDSIREKQIRAGTKIETEGITHQKFLRFRWEGDQLAESLNRDSRLGSLLNTLYKQHRFNIKINLEADRDRIRISNTYHRASLYIDKSDIELFNTIADHVRRIVERTPTRHQIRVSRKAEKAVKFLRVTAVSVGFSAFLFGIIGFPLFLIAAYISDDFEGVYYSPVFIILIVAGYLMMRYSGYYKELKEFWGDRMRNFEPTFLLF